MDYFTLFGFTSQLYPLGLEQLAVRYQDLQRQYHPDKFYQRACGGNSLRRFSIPPL